MEERAMSMVSQHPERRSIDEVLLVGGPPTDGKGVIDYVFTLTEEAAKPMTLHPQCKKDMHAKPSLSGKTNDQSFQECFDIGGYKGAEPQLKLAAYRHGAIAREIQEILYPGTNQVSPEAYEAAGAAVRKLCKASCGLGQWCEWP